MKWKGAWLKDKGFAMHVDNSFAEIVNISELAPECKGITLTDLLVDSYMEAAFKKYHNVFKNLND